MARRDRVPRHKSHTHKRNKNAKLSPFQREQKRAKMANQVPTASTIGSLDTVPHSQRRIFDYLQEKRARQQAKRAELEQARAGLPDEDTSAAEEAEKTSSSTVGSSSGSGSGSGEFVRAAPAAAAASHPSTKKNKPQYASLNDELGASVGAALQPLRSRHGRDAEDEGDAPRTVEEIIARKKERKHKRKQEARRARVATELQEAEAELEAYAKSLTGAGKRNRRKKDGRGDDGAEAERERVNLAFERKLRTMQKEDAAAAAEQTRHANDTDASAAKTNGRKRRRGDTSADVDAEVVTGDGGDDAAQTPARQRKRISFDAEVEERAAAAATTQAKSAAASRQRKPQDFYDLVDVVRYGERVEAPPVFDVVPNRNAAVSRLANALEREERRSTTAGSAAAERHHLLAGGGQLAQQKRLARLGLGPAVTHTTRADGAARMSKEAEIKALRDRVMATYQRNRRKEVVERKGVDMKHEFPQFS